MRRSVLLDRFTLPCGKTQENTFKTCIKNRDIFFTEVRFGTQKYLHKRKTDFQTRKRVGKSVMKLYFIFSQAFTPFASVGHKFRFQYAADLSLVSKELQHIGVPAHTSGVFSFKSLVLCLGQKRKIDTARLHLNTEKTCRSTLSDVGGELCRHDDIALRRSWLTKGDIRAESVSCGSVAVTSCQGLHSSLHLTCIRPCRRMIIVHTSQNILKRKGVMNDTVCRITKAHRQIRCGKVSEERQHKRRYRAFHASRAPDQGQKKFRFMTDLTKELIERREEYRGEARQKHLVGHHTAREQFDKFLRILFDKAFGTVVIPLLSLQLNLIGLVPGQKIVPFTSDLLPPGMREDIPLVGISRRCLDSTPHMLFHLTDHTKVAGGVQAVGNPRHLFKLACRYFYG